MTEHQTYDFEEDGLPECLKRKPVTGCFVDFIYLQDPGTVNHVIVKLIFQHPTVKASKYAPSGTKGLLFNFHLCGDLNPPIEGTLSIKTITYGGPHRDTAHSITLPMRSTDKRGGTTVRRFLAVIKANGLLPCGYNETDAHYVGCRDWV